MYDELTIGSWVPLGAGCPLSRKVYKDDDQVTFACGTSPWDFEFAMAAGALRTFLRLDTEAIAELDALPRS